MLISVALRKESVDRNYFSDKDADWVRVSLSARRAWIEIAAIRRAVWAYYVALRKESVDRNVMFRLIRLLLVWVALRKESVDRNTLRGCYTWIDGVALRKESVDRNREQFKYVVQCRKSLSARRAWIEIKALASRPISCIVALRKESVDRNPTLSTIPPMHASSLSARRAWIEIPDLLSLHTGVSSLSARRAWIEIAHGPVQGRICFCRSPQGERG